MQWRGGRLFPGSGAVVAIDREQGITRLLFLGAIEKYAPAVCAELWSDEPVGYALALYAALNDEPLIGDWDIPLNQTYDFIDAWATRHRLTDDWCMEVALSTIE